MRTFRNITSMTAIGALSASMFAFAAPAGAVAPPTDSQRFERSYYSGDDPYVPALPRDRVYIEDPRDNPYINGGRDQQARLTWSDEWRANVTLPEVWGQRHAASPPQDRYAAPGADARLAEQWQRGHGLWRDQYADARRTMSERDWRAYQDEMRWRQQADQQRMRDAQRWRDMQARQAEQRRQDDMQRRHEEAFRRGYEAGRAYEQNSQQSAYDPWRMRNYTYSDQDRAPGWETRQEIPPTEWGAWRQNGAPHWREFREAPGAAPGNYRSEAPGLRNEGGWERRAFSAHPGVEAGNYR